MAALSRASLVLFEVSTSRLFAASLCLASHRSDRRCLQPLPHLLQCPWAHNSAESSSPRHMQRRDFSVQGTCWGPSKQNSATSAVIILLQCCDLDGILDVLVVSCLVFCHTANDFAVDGAMMLAMDAAPSRADFGRYHLFSYCHALRPDPGNACNTRRTSVPTSPVVVVIKHDANALFEC